MKRILVLVIALGLALVPLLQPTQNPQQKKLLKQRTRWKN